MSDTIIEHGIHFTNISRGLASGRIEWPGALNKSLRATINWSAVGEVDPEIARQFALDLIYVATLLEHIVEHGGPGGK